MCVRVHGVYARVFFCDIPVFSPTLGSTLSLYLRHTHVPDRRVQVCDRLGVLGMGHPRPVFPSAPSCKLAPVWVQAPSSICLVNTEISKAHPSP